MKEREDYRKKIEAQLRKWDTQLDELRLEAEKAKADAKIEYTKTIIELRNKKERMQQKLKELRIAGDEAWTALKDGLEKSVSELKSSFEEALSKFK